IPATAGMPLRPTALRGVFTGRYVGTGAGAAMGSISPAGGSAMSCGLVLLTFSAKLDAAFWLPDVRLAAAVYWYTFFVPLSTIQMSLTLLGLIVRPVGDELAASMVQLPSREPDRLYLKTVSLLDPSSTTQNDVPSVTMPLPLLFLVL